MAIILPLATDTLLQDNHAHMHNVLAVDGSSPSMAILVNGSGNVSIATGGTSPAVALDVYGDIVGSGHTWSDYSSVSLIVGMSTISSKSIYTKRIGKTVVMSYDIEGYVGGTNVNFGAPYISASSPNYQAESVVAYVIDNGNMQSGTVRTELLSNGTTINIYPSGFSWTGGTGSGNNSRAIRGQLWYQSN